MVKTCLRTAPPQPPPRPSNPPYDTAAAAATPRTLESTLESIEAAMVRNVGRWRKWPSARGPSPRSSTHSSLSEAEVNFFTSSQFFWHAGGAKPSGRRLHPSGAASAAQRSRVQACQQQRDVRGGHALQRQHRCLSWAQGSHAPAANSCVVSVARSHSTRSSCPLPVAAEAHTSQAPSGLQRRHASCCTVAGGVDHPP